MTDLCIVSRMKLASGTGMGVRLWLGFIAVCLPLGCSSGAAIHVRALGSAREYGRIDATIVSSSPCELRMSDVHRVSGPTPRRSVRVLRRSEVVDIDHPGLVTGSVGLGHMVSAIPFIMLSAEDAADSSHPVRVLPVTILTHGIISLAVGTALGIVGFTRFAVSRSAAKEFESGTPCADADRGEARASAASRCASTSGSCTHLPGGS